VGITFCSAIPMFIGEFTHTIDDKKRLAMPKKIASELGKKVVITRGLDGALFMYPIKTWGVIAKRLQDLSFTSADSRGFNRFMLSGAAEVDVDGAGRILVPDYLKTFAGLKSKVVLAGVSDRVELWDEEKWSNYKATIERDADKLAEKLAQVGVL
jgi:MraZ protein